MTFTRGTPEDPGNRLVCDAYVTVQADTLAAVTCGEVFDYRNPAARLGYTASGLREAAKGAGWTRIPRRGIASPPEDRCPRHRPIRTHNAGWRGGG